MTRPDLSDAQVRAAYQRELAAVARPWRWMGLALVAAGVALLAAIDHPAARIIGWTFVGLGWAQVLIGIAIRWAYHRRRMRGGAEAGSPR